MHWVLLHNVPSRIKWICPKKCISAYDFYNSMKWIQRLQTLTSNVGTLNMNETSLALNEYFIDLKKPADLCTTLSCAYIYQYSISLDGIYHQQLSVRQLRINLRQTNIYKEVTKPVQTGLWYLICHSLTRHCRLGNKLYTQLHIWSSIIQVVCMFKEHNHYYTPYPFDPSS